MTLTVLVPIAAAIVFLSSTAYLGLRRRAHGKNGWLIPAAASAAFLLFSLYAIAIEGPFGFWPNHTGNLWGNQVWLDLLLAVGIAWSFMVPQARALGMRPGPWLMLIASTGCIGLLAMTARLLYLRDRFEQPARGDFHGRHAPSPPSTSSRPSWPPSRRRTSTLHCSTCPMTATYETAASCEGPRPGRCARRVGAVLRPDPRERVRS